MQPLNRVVLHPPQHMLRLVAADAEIQRIARRKVRLPRRLPTRPPPLRNRVADKNHVRIAAVEPRYLRRTELQQIRVVQILRNVRHGGLRRRDGKLGRRNRWRDSHRRLLHRCLGHHRRRSGYGRRYRRLGEKHGRHKPANKGRHKVETTDHRQVSIRDEYKGPDTPRSKRSSGC